MVLLLLALVAVVALVALAVWIGSPKGPKLREVAHLREPRLVTLPPQRVLLATATGDPNVAGKKAFGLLMRTYFGLKGVPRGGPDFKPPRARWSLEAGTRPEQWTGFYAMPVPESVSALHGRGEKDGLRVELATWEYGEVAEVLHVGAYSTEQSTIDRLKSFIAAQGCEIAGLHEEEYLRGPGMLFAGDPSGYLTIIRYPVRKRAGDAGSR